MDTAQRKCQAHVPCVTIALEKQMVQETRLSHGRFVYKANSSSTELFEIEEWNEFHGACDGQGEPERVDAICFILTFVEDRMDLRGDEITAPAMRIFQIVEKKSKLMGTPKGFAVFVEEYISDENNVENLISMSCWLRSSSQVDQAFARSRL